MPRGGCRYFSCVKTEVCIQNLVLYFSFMNSRIFILTLRDLQKHYNPSLGLSSFYEFQQHTKIKSSYIVVQKNVVFYAEQNW